MWWLTTCSLAFFGAPKIDLGGGKRATLHGKGGPPIVFSSGLYGTMPTFLYRSLFNLMKKNVTLVTVDGASTVTAPVIERISDELGVDSVGFMSHSSFDASVLSCDRVRAAVLCDPIVFPAFGGLINPLTSPSVDLACPVLTIKAERSYQDASTPIPAFLEPLPKDDSLYVSVTLDGVGHADLLDDSWADLGPRMLPWMNGPRPKPRRFRAWTPSVTSAQQSKGMRKRYRKDVADLAVRHVLTESDLVKV